MRNGNILNKKFFQFLLPTALSVMAVSLNEFVDGILVANLIDADAMTLVGMGSPLMIAYGMVYTLLGVGGSTVYAKYLGRYETEKADRAFTVTALAAAAISLAVLLLGFAFMGPLSAALCRAAEYRAVFDGYLKALLLSSVLIIPIQVLISFTPAFGCPGTGTFINIAANAVNLIMDYVLIRFFSMGLAGAAYATLSGYVVGLAIILALCAAGKLRLPFASVSPRDGGELLEAASVGVSPAANQAGYCVKISFSNALAFSLAGMAGTTVFTVCMQAVSMVSVFIGGVINAVIPIVSSLYGQRDYSGVKILMKTAALVQFAMNLAILLFLELWPQGILAIYNVTGESAPLAAAGLRIFALMFLFRGFVLLYIYYFPVIGRRTYAFLISLADGFAGLIPLALLLTKRNGIDGLWQSYALLSVLLLCAVLAVNLVISRRSGGKYSKLLLLEHEDKAIPVYERSIKTEAASVSRLSESIQAFCVREGVEARLALLTALSVEEMGAYTADQNSSARIEDLDILLKIYPDHILMDFRSIGRPFDTSAAPEEYSNMAVLKKIVTSMEYHYILGMNQTRLVCGAVPGSDTVYQTG